MKSIPDRPILAEFRERSQRWAARAGCLFALLASAPLVGAATNTWSGAGGNNLWSNAGNWSANPSATTDTHFFRGSGSFSAITLDSSRTIGGILLGSPQTTALTIANSANTLTLGAVGIDMSAAGADLILNLGNIALGASQTWNVRSGRTLTVSGTITGAGKKVTKTGTGTLVLGGRNTHDGMIITAGTLRLWATQLPIGLKIMPMGDSITYGGGGTQAGYRGPLQTLLNPTVNALAPRFEYAGASVSNPSILPTYPINQTHHNGYSSYATLDLSNNLDGYDPTRFNQLGGADRNPNGGYWITGGNGTGRTADYPDVVLLMVGANDIYQQTTYANPLINVANYQANLTTLVNKLITLRPAVRVIVADITPWASQAANVTLINTAANAAVAALQAQGKRVSLVDMFTLFPANGMTSGGLHPNDTGYTFMDNQWLHAIHASVPGVSQALPGAAPVVVATGATLDLNGNQVTVGGLTGGGTVTLGSGGVITVAAAADIAFDGMLTGAGAVVKTGTATLTLNGVNLNSGATTVSAGGLAVNGSLGTGAVAIQPNARLSGSGTLKGPVTVNGALNPGSNGVGTLSVNSTLTLAATAKTALEIARNGGNLAGDRVQGITALTLGGTLTVTASGEPLRVGDSFNLFTASSYGGAFASVSLPPGYEWDASKLGTTGTITVIGVDLPPAFAGYALATAYQTAATVPLAKILAKATDADGDAFSITGVGPATQGGTVTLQAASLTYTPAAGFSGTDTFPLTITDARGAAVTGVVTITVRAASSAAAGGAGANPPQLTVLPGGGMRIVFHGIPGRAYLVQRSSDLSTWQTLATVTTDSSGMLSLTDETPPPASAYYRLALP
jgi:autotransporter-associated beta strand protein